MTQSIVQIAKSLTDAQKRAVYGLDGAWGLLAGHNAWPLVEYDDIEGDAADHVLRIGLFNAITPENENVPATLLGDGLDIPDVEQCWILQITELGLAVRAILDKQND